MKGKLLRFVQAEKDDFEKITSAYRDIVAHTPQIYENARWEYGKHPSEEEVRGYIDSGNMFMLLDGDMVAGVVAITFTQEEEYRCVRWQIEAEDDKVMVLHLLAIVPAYRRTGTGKKLIQEIVKLGQRKGMKSCRLDTLASNIPAQKFYEHAGLSSCGMASWYVENYGVMDFCMYEIVI